MQADEQGSFEDWLIYIENLALKEGISKDTINNSIKNITQNERVLELDRSQPEFTLTLEKYLSNISKHPACTKPSNCNLFISFGLTL